MTASINEAEAVLAEFRERLDNQIRISIESSIRELESAPHPNPQVKQMKVNVEKVLLDSLSREIESSVVRFVEEVVGKAEKAVNDQTTAVESEIARSRARDSLALSDKLEALESKLASLSSSVTAAVESRTTATARQQSQQSSEASPANPYAGIEHLAKIGQWEDAFRRAVQVFNGVDFMVHLMAPANPEEFFAIHPITDPLLALQVCINAGQELTQSDKSVGLKLEMMSELVLNLVNPARVNLAHQFGQLKDLINQLAVRIQSPRLREIQKIVVATERLMTPAVSVQNTPAPTGRFYPLSPSPMYT